MARALDTKIVPDSMGIRHIVLPYTQEALGRQSADRAQGRCRLRSGRCAGLPVYDATAANGGEVGVMPFSAFSGQCLAAALANAKTGDIVKIASGDAIQLMQVYRADKPSKHVQVASITYPVEASAATRRDIHNSGRHLLGERQRFGRSVQRRRFGCRASRRADRVAHGAGRAYDPRS